LPFLGILHSLPASAEAITYIYDGIGSGSLGASSFDSVAFIITALADTDNISPWPAAADLQNTHLSTSIQIAGLGTFDIFTPSHTWIGSAEEPSGGLGKDLGINWITIQHPGLVGYQLDTALGPLLDTTPEHWDQFNNVTTSGGSLSFSFMTSVTFTAAPEPSRWLLLAAGLGCLVALRRVSRRG
jgi:hypothetical protein